MVGWLRGYQLVPHQLLERANRTDEGGFLEASREFLDCFNNEVLMVVYNTINHVVMVSVSY